MKKTFLVIIGILGFAGIAIAAPSVIYQRTLIPETHNTQDLGTTTQAWRNLYVAGTTATNNLTISGTCTGCNATNNPDLIYTTSGGTKYYTASSTASDNLSWLFKNGFVAQASSTISSSFNINGSLTLPSLTLGGLAVGSGGLVYKSATTTFSSPLVYSAGDVSCSSCVTTSRNIFTTYPLQGGGALSGDLTLSTAFGTTTNIGVGLSKLLAVDNSGIIIASSTIGNGQLQNSSIVVTTASPLGGAGTIPLGGTLDLTCTGCVTSAVTSITGGLGLNGGAITTSGTLSLKSYIATSTADTANQVLFFTSTGATPATFGGSSGLTFSSTGSLLTATYASTTMLTSLNGATFATVSGNVGIGTTSPTNLLTVAGNADLYNSGSNDEIVSVGKGTNDNMQIRWFNTAAYGRIQTLQAGTAAGNLALQSAGGNVGIGTTNPTASLQTTGFLSTASSTVTSTFDLSGATVKIHNYPAFTVASTSLMTGTTTIPLKPTFVQETWNNAICYTDVGTAVIQFFNSNDGMNSFAISTASSSVAISTNNVILASAKVSVKIGTLASTPNYITCGIDKTTNK